MSEVRTIDLRGLKCPTPIVRLNEAIRDIVEGEELTAVANDRAFELDVKAWCRRTGHQLLSFDTDADDITVCLRKRAG